MNLANYTRRPGAIAGTACVIGLAAGFISYSTHFWNWHGIIPMGCYQLLFSAQYCDGLLSSPEVTRELSLPNASDLLAAVAFSVVTYVAIVALILSSRAIRGTTEPEKE